VLAYRASASICGEKVMRPVSLLVVITALAIAEGDVPGAVEILRRLG
jgi:hypothetical protein